MNNTEREEPIRVILVEDDRDSGHALTTMLGKRGLLVRRTHSAEEVMSEVDLAAHDIIVADIRLTGLNGVDLLRHIRNRSPDFPVILLTAYDSIESAIQAVRFGAQDYILKPLDTIDDLIVPVKKAVRAHRLLIRSRQLEKELKESEEEYRTLVENLNIGVYRSTGGRGAEGRFLKANPAITKMLGFDSIAEFMNIAVEQLYQSPKDRERLLDDLAGNGFVRDRELQCSRKDGTPIWVSCAAVAKHNENGRIQWIDGVLEDITERKQAEAALRRSYGQLRELAARLQSVREEERTRISREIHDELGHALTGLKMDLFWISKRIRDARETLSPQAIAEKLSGMTGVIDRTIDTVRRIASELRPGLLDHLGLRAAVEWQMRQFRERTGIACSLSGSAEGVDLNEDQTTGMFRILEEILTNVARHAGAGEVSVKLTSAGGKFMLEVSDNGKGITEKQIADYQALGILGMRERARIMGGEFAVKGQPGRGTTVSVTVPVADHLGER